VVWATVVGRRRSGLCWIFSAKIRDVDEGECARARSFVVKDDRGVVRVATMLEATDEVLSWSEI